MSRKTTPTHVLLNQVTLAASTSSITFSAIPQTYGDLVVVFVGRSNSGGSTQGFATRFNEDTGSNYPRVSMLGNGSFTTSTTASQTFIANPIAGDTLSSVIFSIMDYSQADKHKTVLFRANVTNGHLFGATAGRWSNTTPIASITLFDENNNGFTSGSTFSLYGVIA
jgi:hypothetical protein